MAKERPSLRRAILFVNPRKECAREAAREIRQRLEGDSVEVTEFLIEERSAAAPEGEWDLAFSLGGDGTALFAARALAESATPILPAHLGRVGFLAGVEMREWEAVFQSWLSGEARVSERSMMDVWLEREGRASRLGTCLNDALISSSDGARLISLDARSEMPCGAFAELGPYRCDGLIVATPTGSTAHSMAAGGPVIDPEMDARVVIPICPFSLSSRPLVLPASRALYVDVAERRPGAVALALDGRRALDLRPGDSVALRDFPRRARLITSGTGAYYTALRKKLAWQSGSAAEGAQGGLDA